MEMKNTGRWSNFGFTMFLAISGVVLLFFFLSRFTVVRDVVNQLNLILRPVYYGVIMSFLLLPVHRRAMTIQRALFSERLQERRWVQSLMRGLAVLASLLFGFVVIYFILALLLPQLYLSIVGLVNEIPTYISEIQIWITKFLEDNPEFLTVVITYYDVAAESLAVWLETDLIPNLSSLDSTISWLKSVILPNVTGVFSNVYGFIIAMIVVMKDIFIGVIVSVYLLARKDIFAAQSKKVVYSALPTHIADLVVVEVREAYAILSGFINGKLLDSLIVGIITLVIGNIIGFPYPVLIATIIGITNIIPFFGPFIGGVPCGVIILLVSPIQCLYFTIFIIALQQFDGNILGPKILGESTGLASFWVLFSILLFSGLFGFTGMVFGVPIFAIIYNVTKKLVTFGLKKRRLPVDTEEYMGPTGPLATSKESEVPIVDNGDGQSL